MIILAGDYAVFLEFLQGNIMEFLNQIVEEGVILAFNDAKQGLKTSEDELSYHYRFMYLALDFLDLSVTRHFAEYIPSVSDCLSKIHSRFDKLVN